MDPNNNTPNGMQPQRRLQPPRKRLRTAIIVIVVVGVAVVLGLITQQIVNRIRTAPKTASGLPKVVDDVQNLRLQGDAKEADKQLDAALADPKTPDEQKQQLYMQKAYGYLDAKDFQAAIDTLKKANAIGEDPQIYLLIGQTYFQMGDKAQARASYVKALAILSDVEGAAGLKRDLQQRIDIIDGKIDVSE